MHLERHPFPTDPGHAQLLQVLLVQDGSTTRICEALSGGPIDVTVHRQIRTAKIPEVVNRYLGGDEWLERITSLSSRGQVLMDNLSYTRLDAVPEAFLNDLDRGIAPIGHLLAQLYVQREALDVGSELAQRLWEIVGVPDPNASRAYRMLTAAGPFMLIFESFRAGLAKRG